MYCVTPSTLCPGLRCMRYMVKWRSFLDFFVVYRDRFDLKSYYPISSGRSRLKLVLYVPEHNVGRVILG